MEKSNKRICAIALTLSAVFGATLLAAGCSQEAPPVPLIEGNFVTDGVEEALEQNYLSEGVGLTSGGYQLSLVRQGEEYGVQVATETQTLFLQSAPIRIAVRGLDLGENSFEESENAQGYNAVGRHAYGVGATGTVTTESGSIFKVYDLWFVSAEGTFGLSRKVEVEEEGAKDLGFSSTIDFRSQTGSTDIYDYEFVFPSLHYRDADHLYPTSLGALMDGNDYTVKETRMGMPYVMMRDTQSEATVTVSHYQPQVSVNGVVGGGVHGEANGKLQYGSLGYINRTDGIYAGFTYPCDESANVVGNEMGETRFHPVAKDVPHAYKVSVIPSANTSYNDAFAAATLQVYGKGQAELFDADLDDVYASSMQLLSIAYSERGVNEIKAAGLPFALSLDSLDRVNDPSMQMGFVGAQTSLAAQMIDYGYRTGDDSLRNKGLNMINFWTSETIYPSNYKLPIVWWDRTNNAAGGWPRLTAASNLYPAFLRMLCDGMDGIMEAYKYVEAHGDTAPEAWMRSVLRVAEFFKTKQAYDGSLCRAYDQITGNINTDNSDKSYQGSSKLNTASVVPFFYKVSDYYTDIGNTELAEEYAAAAKKAVDFVYETVYMGLGRYVGGTLDQPNIVDKEAGIFATRAFSAAYLVTGDEKYLTAAEHAACFVLTFVYTYDFAVPCADENQNKYNPFKEGGTSGWSRISTSTGGGDIFAAYTVYDFYKLYVLTGKEVYRNIAIFIEGNTKQAVDYDGRHGFAYTATSPEASSCFRFNYSTVDAPGIWLPWNTDACIRPMSDLRNLFGTYKISEISLSIEQQRAVLAEYGLGGKIKSE